MSLQVPNVLLWLSQNTLDTNSSALEEGILSLLDYMPLIDLADAKCQYV